MTQQQTELVESETCKDLEITELMIGAGMDALTETNSDDYGYDQRVVRIFQAMVRASPAGLQS